MFIVVALICLIEARRLSLDTHAVLLSQRLGPGLYIYLLGGVLLVTGIVYLATHIRSASETASEPVSLRRVLAVTAVLAVYALLIERFGYTVASFMFFVALFWMLGVRRWYVNVPLSLAFAAAFYIVFIQLFQVIFPAGAWFDPFA